MLRVLGRKRTSNSVREMNLLRFLEDGFLIPVQLWIFIQDFAFLGLVRNFRCSIGISSIRFSPVNLAICDVTRLRVFPLPTTSGSKGFRGLGGRFRLILPP